MAALSSGGRLFQTAVYMYIWQWFYNVRHVRLVLHGWVSHTLFHSHHTWPIIMSLTLREQQQPFGPPHGSPDLAGLPTYIPRVWVQNYEQPVTREWWNGLSTKYMCYQEEKSIQIQYVDRLNKQFLALISCRPETPTGHCIICRGGGVTPNSCMCTWVQWALLIINQNSWDVLADIFFCLIGKLEARNFCQPGTFHTQHMKMYKWEHQ